MDSVLENPGRQAVETAALTWPERARSLRITSPEVYTKASMFLKGIKGLRDEANGIFDPSIKAANDAHKAAIEAKRKVETPLAEAERIIKTEMVRYDDEQERERRRLQREAEEAERRRIEDDNLNLAVHMEREGKEFGDEGLVQEAHELIAQPIIPVVAPVIKATPIIAGQHFATTWSAQVTSLLELVKYVAKNPSFIGLLQANQTALNAQARSLKEHMALPGVKPIPTKNVAARR